MSKKHCGVLAALLTNIIFGFSFIFEKIALEIAHPLVVIAVRFSIAFFLMSLLLAFRVVKVDFRGKNLRKVLLMSLMQPVCYFVCEMYALTSVSTAMSGIIIALKPVMTIFMAAIFLGEKTTRFQKICSATSLAGVVGINILAGEGGENSVAGVFLMFLAALSATIYGILTRSESGEFSSFERTFLMMASGAIAFNILAATTLRGAYFDAVAHAIGNRRFMISMFYLAVISSIVAFFAFNFASAHISAVMAAAFSNVVTVIAVVAGMLILHEKFSAVQLFLCVPVLAGVAGVNMLSEKTLLRKVSP